MSWAQRLKRVQSTPASFAPDAIADAAVRFL
jgi:hypothetical protein